MGGKCGVGSQIRVKAAQDSKGRLVGADSVSKLYGTPKCEFICQLLKVNEQECETFTEVTEDDGSVWCGAHPALGETVAQALVESGALNEELGRVVTGHQREVAKPFDLDLRVDFELRHDVDPLLPLLPTTTLLEVKHVVDTDYAPLADDEIDLKVSTKPLTKKQRNSKEGLKNMATAPTLRDSNGDILPYRRSAIFPWGSRSAQKGPLGESVVSARAIKHVNCLKEAVVKNHSDAAILFVCMRPDVVGFRPHVEACPSFAKYLKEASEVGVKVLAQRVRWSEDGAAFGCGSVPVEI
jgi:hypothetical protein